MSLDNHLLGAINQLSANICCLTEQSGGSGCDANIDVSVNLEDTCLQITNCQGTTLDVALDPADITALADAIAEAFGDVTVMVDGVTIDNTCENPLPVATCPDNPLEVTIVDPPADVITVDVEYVCNTDTGLFDQLETIITNGVPSDPVVTATNIPCAAAPEPNITVDVEYVCNEDTGVYDQLETITTDGVSASPITTATTIACNVEDPVVTVDIEFVCNTDTGFWDQISTTTTDGVPADPVTTPTATPCQDLEAPDIEQTVVCDPVTGTKHIVITAFDIDGLANILSDVDTGEPCNCPTPFTPECIKKRTFTVGYDNGITPGSSNNDCGRKNFIRYDWTFTVDYWLVNGQQVGAGQTLGPFTGWTPQLQGWADWFNANDPNTNSNAAFGFLPAPTWRFTEITGCDPTAEYGPLYLTRDDGCEFVVYPVLNSETTEFGFRYAEHDCETGTKSLVFCDETGTAVETPSDAECYVPCGYNYGHYLADVSSPCTISEIREICDKQPDESLTNFVQIVNLCDGELFVENYTQESWNTAESADDLVEYTPTGEIVDCATGEPITYPSAEGCVNSEQCWTGLTEPTLVGPDTANDAAGFDYDTTGATYNVANSTGSDTVITYVDIHVLNGSGSQATISLDGIVSQVVTVAADGVYRFFLSSPVTIVAGGSVQLLMGAAGNTGNWDHAESNSQNPWLGFDTIAVSLFTGGGVTSYKVVVCPDGTTQTFDALGNEIVFNPDGDWTQIECPTPDIDLLQTIADQTVVKKAERCYRRKKAIVNTDNLIDITDSTPTPAENIVVIPGQTADIACVTIRVDNTIGPPSQPFAVGIPFAVDINGTVYQFDAVESSLASSLTAPWPSDPGHLPPGRWKLFFYTPGLTAQAGVPLTISHVNDGSAPLSAGDPNLVKWTVNTADDNGQVQAFTDGQYPQIGLFSNAFECYSECDFTDGSTIVYGPDGDVIDAVPSDAEQVRCDKLSELNKELPIGKSDCCDPAGTAPGGAGATAIGGRPNLTADIITLAGGNAGPVTATTSSFPDPPVFLSCGTDPWGDTGVLLNQTGTAVSVSVDVNSVQNSNFGIGFALVDTATGQALPITASGDWTVLGGYIADTSTGSNGVHTLTFDTSTVADLSTLVFVAYGVGGANDDPADCDEWQLVAIDPPAETCEPRDVMFTEDQCVSGKLDTLIAEQQATNSLLAELVACLCDCDDDGELPPEGTELECAVGKTGLTIESNAVGEITNTDVWAGGIGTASGWVITSIKVTDSAGVVHDLGVAGGDTATGLASGQTTGVTVSAYIVNTRDDGTEYTCTVTDRAISANVVVQ